MYENLFVLRQILRKVIGLWTSDPSLISSKFSPLTFLFLFHFFAFHWRWPSKFFFSASLSLVALPPFFSSIFFLRPNTYSQRPHALLPLSLLPPFFIYFYFFLLLPPIFFPIFFHFSSSIIPNFQRDLNLTSFPYSLLSHLLPLILLFFFSHYFIIIIIFQKTHQLSLSSIGSSASRHQWATIGRQPFPLFFDSLIPSLSHHTHFPLLLLLFVFLDLILIVIVVCKIWIIKLIWYLSFVN